MTTALLAKEDGTIFSNDLTRTFCDRLNQLIDRRPDVIRTGRGKVVDFASKFDIHYTTAHRLIHAESLPSATLLLKIADTFDVSESWLLGRGSREIEDMLGEALTRISIFNPREPELSRFIGLPAGVIPSEMDTSTLIYTRTGVDAQDDHVLVKTTAEPIDGRVHLVYDPATKITYLRRISVMLGRDELLCFSLGNGQTETLKNADIVFGQTNEAQKLSIVGPVVARVSFGFKGD